MQHLFTYNIQSGMLGVRKENMNLTKKQAQAIASRDSRVARAKAIQTVKKLESQIELMWKLIDAGKDADEISIEVAKWKEEYK